GARLALAARAIAYHEDLPWSGPVYDHMTIGGSKITVQFRHADGGLVTKPIRSDFAARLGVDANAVCGFTIAGADQVFYNAHAEVVGSSVVVSSPQVANPVAVRCGWAMYPVVNLWNEAGLPVSPFRTDTFRLGTQR